MTKSRIKAALRLIVLTLVVVGIVHSVRKSMLQLAEQRINLTDKAATLRLSAESATGEKQRSELLAEANEVETQYRKFWQADARYLLAAGVCYGVGMLPALIYWNLCLRALGQMAPIRAVLWGYFYGHLGKYFPGKAMVIVLRLSALERLETKKVAVTITVFMETLTMMSVGGAVAAICLILLNIDWRMTLLAIGLLILTFVPTIPGFLRAILPRLQPGVEPETIANWTSRIHWKLLLQGWLLQSLNWIGLGTSLYLVLLGLPSSTATDSNTLQLLLSVFGACGLAVVLGFVSLIPGGAGVREAVLSTVLTPVVGPIAALCGALWLRIVWLCTELLMVVILAPIRMRDSQKFVKSTRSPGDPSSSNQT